MNLTLLSKDNLADNVWSFRFKPDEPLTWVAGQFIEVELPHDNPDSEGTKRWFTISAAPYEGEIQITTRVTGTTFKQALSKLPLDGKITLVAKPDGDFTWTDSDKPRIFVAGGIGITPFRSILAQRSNDHLPLPVTLVYSSRTPDVPFKDEFAKITGSNPNFKIKYVTGERLTADKLRELNLDLKNSLVYVSGPEPLVESLGDALRAAGQSEELLKQDFFPNYNETNY